MMSNELARYDAGAMIESGGTHGVATRRGSGIQFPVPRNFDELLQIANLLAQSNFVPKEFKGSPGDVVAAVQFGAEIGLAPMQALQSICVINGKPSIYGDAALALVRSAVTDSGRPVMSSIREGVIRDDKGALILAYCEVQRFNESEPRRVEFSVQQAIKAKLWGKVGPWTDYPERMLQMRARSWALRDVFPDVLRGMYIVEEAQDSSGAVAYTFPSTAPPPPASPLKAAQSSLLDDFCALASAMGYDASTRPQAAQTIRAILALPETHRPTTGDIERAIARLREIQLGEEDSFADAAADELELDVPAAVDNLAAFAH